MLKIRLCLKSSYYEGVEFPSGFMTVPTPIPAALEKIVQRFARVTEPKRKYEQLIFYAKKVAAMPDEDKIDENKVMFASLRFLLQQNWTTVRCCSRGILMRSW